MRRRGWAMNSRQRSLEESPVFDVIARHGLRVARVGPPRYCVIPDVLVVSKEIDLPVAPVDRCVDAIKGNPNPTPGHQVWIATVCRITKGVETDVVMPLEEVDCVGCHVQRRVDALERDARPAIGYLARVARIDDGLVNVPAHILVPVKQEEFATEVLASR